MTTPSSRFSLTIESAFVKWIALALVIVGGVFPRLNHIGKSLWSAEAWVANSVLADSLTHMFRYETWLQTTPPLFLLLVRWTVQLAGVSVGSFRAVPFGLSILSLVLIAWLAQRILQIPFAVICTALVALSPPAVVFSKEVKQYTGDVAASCMLLLALWSYLERPDTRRYLSLAAVLAIALFLSYPAVTFVPVAIALVGVVAPLFNEDPSNGQKTRLARVGILSGIAVAICGVNYWFFVRPNSSPLLSDYWSNGYPRFGHASEVARFYAEDFLGMGLYFYIPIGTKNLFKALGTSMGHWGWLLVFLVALAVMWIALAALRRNRRSLQAFAICISPMITLAVINVLHLYPVSSRRLTLFMLPCVSLAAAVVMQSLWDVLTKNLRWGRANLFAAFLTLLCIVAVLVAGTHSDQWGNYWFEDEDTAGALSFVRSHGDLQDTIYVHASVEETAKFYFRLMRWSPPDVRYGNTGWGCCTRVPESLPKDTHAKNDYVIGDFERVMLKGRPRRIWLIFTGLDGYWGGIGRNEPQIIAGYLFGIGCQKELETSFAKEEVQEFECRRGIVEESGSLNPPRSPAIE
jgi:hypothetical protein